MNLCKLRPWGARDCPLRPGPLPSLLCTLTFAREAVDEAQEPQQADFIAWVSEVGPGCVDVAGRAALLPADICLQHQTAGGLSVLQEPAHATYGEGEEGEGDSELPSPLMNYSFSLCGKLVTNTQHPRSNAPSNCEMPVAGMVPCPRLRQKGQKVTATVLTLLCGEPSSSEPHPSAPAQPPGLRTGALPGPFKCQALGM